MKTMTTLFHMRNLLIISFLFPLSTLAGENLDSLFAEARQAAMDTSSRKLAIEMCQRDSQSLSRIRFTKLV